MVYKNVERLEFQEQKQEIVIQSQAITHTLQQQFYRHAQLLSMTAKRWNSINDINKNWQQDVDTLTTLLPNFSNINIYLLHEQESLTINYKVQRLFTTKTELALNASQLMPLDKNISIYPVQGAFLSEHEILDNNQAISYLHAPILNDEKLIGYLEATLNITELLDYHVARYQIRYPFSLADAGRTIYSVLPEHVRINDIQQQFTIPLLNHYWKLIVWPLRPYYLYHLLPLIGFVFSLLIAKLFHSVVSHRRAKQQLTLQQQHLTNINEDINASKSRLVQSNKLSSLGEIATGITHEINQPLQVISIHSDLCQESLQQQDYFKVEKSFRAIISQVDRIEKIVKQVGSFARNSELDSYVLETPTVIFENVINIIINQYNQDNVELRQVLPASLPSILCNKIQIEQVLVNLLINAKDAVEECDKKVVFIKAHEKDGQLHIEVSDTGCGIELNKLSDIFNPFYTTKALGKGTGLGLSISYTIIHQHSGDLLVSSEIGKGSTFTVVLPIEEGLEKAGGS